ncbi:MAG TPA: hypothetical protein EYH31_00360 [Anaerolineae bacterium]|nr:hypothetical protein [Anaerolineae bacterium]
MLHFGEAESVEMRPCRVCGQPTTADDLCAFCRLWGLDKEIGEQLAPALRSGAGAGVSERATNNQ